MSTFVFYFLLLVVTLLIGWKTGYFQRYLIKRGIYLNVALSAFNMLTKLQENKRGPNIKIGPNNKFAVVEYQRYGKTHQIYTPYFPEIVSLMRRIDVLLKKNNELIPINLQNGVPVMISADLMGGESFIIRRKIDQEIIATTKPKELLNIAKLEKEIMRKNN